MKLMTRDTDYAVRSIAFIAGQKGKITSVTELVGCLKIPYPFLRKILQILKRNNILKSYKGKGGGFLLGRPANRIFLVDLIEIFQGPFRLNECFLKKRICLNVSSCALKRKIDKIEKYVIRQLKSITIGDLV